MKLFRLLEPLSERARSSDSPLGRSARRTRRRLARLRGRLAAGSVSRYLDSLVDEARAGTTHSAAPPQVGRGRGH